MTPVLVGQYNTLKVSRKVDFGFFTLMMAPKASFYPNVLRHPPCVWAMNSMYLFIMIRITG